jgi:hypothetical protein
MIVGAQKSGTTALAHFLGQHEEICFSSVKENHIFDSLEFSDTWTSDKIDALYTESFAHYQGEACIGEATPIYMLYPGIAPALSRYNPEMKIIVLLRDSVDRAVSHYYMEKSRKLERYPLWLALLLEPYRLYRDRKKQRNPDSAMRVSSYRKRGLYSVQLEVISQSFDREQMLILKSSDLLDDHEKTLRKVFQFLDLSIAAIPQPEMIHQSENDQGSHPIVKFLLRLSYRLEYSRMKKWLP